MGSLIVVTGPPGAGKSTVSAALAGRAETSVLVEGDRFFGFLAAGAIEPWLPESNLQNTVVTEAAAVATGRFAADYETVYDGVLGPWFLPTFASATGLTSLDYVVILPSVEECVRRVASRIGHEFTDEAAARKMHEEFAGLDIAPRHVVSDDTADVAGVVDLILQARSAGHLHYAGRL